MRRYGLELNHAARSVIRDALAIQKGESLVITADTISDAVVAESLAEECHSAGGKPLIVWMRTPAGVAMAADADLPREALVGLLEKADAWIELNVRYLNYSRIFREAMSRNDRLRFYCLPGITVDVLMRCFAGLDFGVLAEFLDRVTDYTRCGVCTHGNSGWRRCAVRQRSGSPVRQRGGLCKDARITHVPGPDILDSSPRIGERNDRL